MIHKYNTGCYRKGTYRPCQLLDYTLHTCTRLSYAMYAGCSASTPIKNAGKYTSSDVMPIVLHDHLLHTFVYGGRMLER